MPFSAVMPFSFVIAWGFLAAVLAPAAAEAQLQQATVTAVVLEASGEPRAGVAVVLTDPLGGELQARTTDRAGRATFTGVAPGRYELRATTATGPPLQLPIAVAGALPLEIVVRVPRAVTDRVVVEGMADEPSSRGSLAAESALRVPTRLRARALQEVIATLPGWFTEDNGLLHARGVDDGFLYVIDGVPVYERLDALHGIAPDLGSVESITVITGYVSPEFGHKAGGVIEVRTALADAWTGDVDVATGSDALGDGAGALGGRFGSRASFRVGAAASASNRFLDPVHPDNLHNHGTQATTFGQLAWSPSAADRLSVGWGGGRSRFDVPNNEEQEEAGQQQRQRIGQGFVNATWQRALTSSVVAQGAVYHRRTEAALDGSPFDTPLEAHADRSLARTGVLFALTRQQGHHLLKGGLEVQRLSLDEAFQFYITDPDEAEEAEFRDEALVFTRDNPFVFAGAAVRSLWSAYLQDTWQAAPRLTLSGGVRFDRSRVLLTRSQWSPRAGIAFRLSDDTLLRASLSRYFQPPQPENLLLSSSPEARVLSSIVVGDAEGGADIEPERQWGTELGLDHRLGRARLDLAYWARRARHVADPNVFAGTTIIFPNAVARGRAHGFDARLEVPQLGRWSGFASATVSRVVQTGPIEGGLFLEDEVEEIGPGVEFAPDHDQRFTIGGSVTWEHPSGPAVSMHARYETGTPVQLDDDDLAELLGSPGAEMVDFDTGRVKPRAVVSLRLAAPVYRSDRIHATAAVQVLNLFDRRYAFNFGNPFSGTHFGAPRTFTVSMRVGFR